MKHTTLFIIALSTSMVSLAQKHQAAVTQQEAHQDTISLQEVVVKASRPVSRLETDGIKTTIQGTPLQAVGTARDVLGFLPGVVSSEAGIEVLGKGAPMIYINGRQVYSPQEIDQLQSVRIKDVVVITNPGAKYASNINAVIKITTVKELGDGLALDNRAVGKFNNYLNAIDVLWMNYRQGGLDIFSTLEYDYAKNRGGNEILMSNMTPTNYYSTSMQSQSHSRSQTFDGKIGFNYVLSPLHTFGAFYQATHTPARTNMHNESFGLLNTDLTFDSQTDESNRTKKTTHLVEAYYNGTWGGFSTEITFDALWRNANECESVSELLNGSVTNLGFDTDDRSRGRMYAGKIDISHALWKGAINFGSEYTNSSRKESLSSDFSQIPSSDNKINEDNIGLYAETSQRFGQAMLMAGLRYEHIGSKYFENGIKIGEQSKDYNELLPSATLVLPIRNSRIQLSYSRKYKRPLYEQLSSSVTYSNPTIYSVGNPLLKSTYINDVSVNFMWKWLMVMGQYQHITGQIIDKASPYNGNPDITLLTKVNSNRPIHQLQLMAQMQWGMVGRYYYPVVAAGFVSQFFDIDFRGNNKNMNNPMAIVKWMNIFMLPGGYRLGANLSYRSEGDNSNVHVGQTWQIDLNVSKTFGQHWEIKLAINDMLNTAANTSYTIYSGTQMLNMNKRLSTRNVEFTVNYRFNVTKSKYKGNAAGQSEAERL